MIMDSKRMTGIKTDKLLFLLSIRAKISRSLLFIAFVMGSDTRYDKQRIAPEMRRFSVLLNVENWRKTIGGMMANIEAT